MQYKKRFTVFSIIFLIIVLAHKPYDLKVYAGTTEEWNIIERGDSFIRKRNVDNPQIYSWEAAPLWISNGSQFVPYIFRDKYVSEGFFEVSTGLISARIYSYYAEFYAPENFSDVRLYSEMWEIQRYTNKWSDIGAQSGSPTFIVTQDETSVNITKSFTSWAGELKIIYTFGEGPLKHTVYFNSILVEETTYRVKQQWAGIVGDKVGEETITTATEFSEYSFRFLKNDGSLSIFENQFQAIEHLEPVIIDTHAQGLKCDYIFSNFSLAQGESLEIDPDTKTLDNPTEDGFVYDSGLKYADVTTLSFGVVGDAPADRITRAYAEWNTSTIPSTATITKVEFRYHADYHATGASNTDITGLSIRPSTAAGGDLFQAIIAGTVYLNDNSVFPAEGTGKDIGGGSGPAWDTDPSSDLQTALSNGWWAFGFLTKETEDPPDPVSWSHRIYAEEWGSANPKPTLYVEYTMNYAPTSPTFTAPSNNSKHEPSSLVNVTWAFNDPDPEDSQGSYQVQASESSSFETTFHDSNKTASSNQYLVVEFPSVLGIYYVRVKTWDSENLESAWSSTLFVEIAHATTTGGWTPSSIVSGVDDVLIDESGPVTPVPQNWGLGIAIIIGTVGTGLIYSEFNGRKSKKGGAKAFADKPGNKNKRPEGFDGKKERRGGPDKFKQKARR